MLTACGGTARADSCCWYRRCGIIRSAAPTQASVPAAGGTSNQPYFQPRAGFSGSIAMILTALGLMSGTSLDGVDVALIETDGRQIMSLGPSGYRPYGPAVRSLLRVALADGVQMGRRGARPGRGHGAEL